LCLAGFRRVIEGGAFAVGVGGAEEESLLGIIGETDEAGLAVGVGSDFEVEFVEAHEAVGDVDADVGGINRLARVVRDNEIGGAGAQAGIDFSDGRRVDRSGADRKGGEVEYREGEQDMKLGSESVRHWDSSFRIRLSGLARQ